MADVGMWPVPLAPHGGLDVGPVLWALYGRLGGAVGLMGPGWPHWGRGRMGPVWLPWRHGRSNRPRMAAVGRGQSNRHRMAAV